MFLGVRAVHQNRQRMQRRWLGITLLLGSAFLAIQGSEWVRLVAHGLKLSSGTYGATFYTLIGLHGAHVTAAVVWLAFIVISAMRGRYNAKNAEPGGDLRDLLVFRMRDLAGAVCARLSDLVSQRSMSDAF